MSERDNIKNLDGNLEALRRHENEVDANERAYDQACDELYDDVIDALEDFKDKLKELSKRDGLELYEEAVEMVKDEL